MKRLIYLLLFCLPLTAAAQTIAVEAIVMDAQTQESLPYASIYISNTNSTITNAEGGFRVIIANGKRENILTDLMEHPETTPHTDFKV